MTTAITRPWLGAPDAPPFTGELSAQPTEGADVDVAPSTTLRVVLLPRFTGEEPGGEPVRS